MIYLLIGFILYSLLIFLIPTLFWHEQKGAKEMSSESIPVILGLKLDARGNPSIILKSRVKAALLFYKQKQPSYIICSGGSPRKAITEAEVMSDLLVENNVLVQQILLEKCSTNTYENIKYSQKLLQTYDYKAITIISSTWHRKKALFYAQRLGVNASFYAAKCPKELRLLLPCIYFFVYSNMTKNILLYRRL